MDIIAELKEAKARLEALATTAASVEGLNASVQALTGEKETLAASLSKAGEELASLREQVAALTEAKAAAETEVANLVATKQETEAKALELVSELGLRQPVKVDPQAGNEQTAEQVRARYAELQSKSPSEAGRYFQEHRDTILNNFRS